MFSHFQLSSAIGFSMSQRYVRIQERKRIDFIGFPLEQTRNQITSRMSDLQLNILKVLGAKGSIPDSTVEFPNEDSQQIQAALNSLLARSMVSYKTSESEVYKLTDEAKDIVQHGSHEYRLLNKVIESLEGLKVSDVDSVMGKTVKLHKVGRSKTAGSVKMVTRLLLRLRVPQKLMIQQRYN